VIFFNESTELNSVSITKIAKGTRNHQPSNQSRGESRLNRLDPPGNRHGNTLGNPLCNVQIIDSRLDPASFVKIILADHKMEFCIEKKKRKHKKKPYT